MPPRTDPGELAKLERMLPPVPPRPRRRGRALGWTAAAVGAAVLFGGGWFSAAAFESPAQQAAHAAAPKPGTITADVSQGALQQIVTSNATVERQTRQTIAVTAADGPAVVTAAPIAEGRKVAAGAVVLEVDGQPVFAVPGRFAFYRDLTVGDTGPDVVQLQRALDAAGYRVAADGSFGAGTQTAVEELYRRAGYVPPMTAEPDDAAATTPAEPPGGTTPDQAGAAPAPTSPASAFVPAPASAPVPAPPAVDVPATAFLVAGALPANLVSAPAVGALVGDSTSITLETGALIASAQVPPDSAAELRKGLAVTLTGSNGTPVPASVASVAQPAEDGNNATVVMTAASELPDAWLHQTVLATITVQVAAKDSLIVPTAAIVTAGDGQAHVLKESADGSFTEIPVTETATLSGKSAITVAGDALKPGDNVKVG